MDNQIIVDAVECGPDWIKGCINGSVVITYEGVSDFSTIHLYDANREEVTPISAPLDEITKLQLAFAELVEGVLV